MRPIEIFLKFSCQTPALATINIGWHCRQSKKVYYNCLTKKCVLYFGYGKTIEPKAALLLLYFAEGSSSPPDERKEGDTMYVTYQNFFLFCTFIVALISLLYQIFKGKK